LGEGSLGDASVDLSIVASVDLLIGVSVEDASVEEASVDLSIGVSVEEASDEDASVNLLIDVSVNLLIDASVNLLIDASVNLLIGVSIVDCSRSLDLYLKIDISESRLFSCT
jgi:hypothetical protein